MNLFIFNLFTLNPLRRKLDFWACVEATIWKHSQKLRKKMEAKKHRKKWKTWKAENKKKKLFIVLKKENAVRSEGNGKNPVLKKDKHLGVSQNHAEEPHCLDYDRKDICEKLDSSCLQFLEIRKGKKTKTLQGSAFVDSNREALRDTKHKHLHKTLSPDPYVNGKGELKGLSWREALWLQLPCKGEALDSAVCCFRGNVIKGFKQTVQTVQRMEPALLK